MRNIVKLVVVLAFLMAGVLIAGISRRTLRGTSSFEMGTKNRTQPQIRYELFHFAQSLCIIDYR